MNVKKLMIEGVVLTLIALWSENSIADNWTGSLKITSIQSIVNQESGVIRLYLNQSVSTSNCGTSNIIEFIYTNGSEQANSAVVAALYEAVALNTSVTFLLSSSSCTSWNYPMIVGVAIPQQ